MELSDQDILLELTRRGGELLAPPNFLDGTFHFQENFITDPAKLKVLICTRRSGKSYGDGLYLFKEAFETPRCSVIYVAITRETAKKIMWKDVLKEIDRKLNLRAKFNETDLTATLPNGSVVYLLGVDSAEEEKRKLLGQKYKLAIVDEPQSMSIDLNELIYGILKPAIADYRGTICLTGTPGNLKKGLFYELTAHQDPQEPGCWETQGWSGHRWTTFQNPYMLKQWGEEILDLKTANPRIEETPLYQQHYLGRWVVDDTRLVYRYQEGRNDFESLPTFAKGNWHYVLGIDLGYNDPTAFTLSTWHDFDKTLYILESSKQSRMDVTDVAERTRQFMKAYDLEAIVIDNSAKQAVAELERRHDIPLTPADKIGKSDFIEIMNGEFIQGRIKLRKNLCLPLIDEYAGLIWDDKSTKRVEHAACANHAADASLYNWRFCWQYLSDGPPRARPKEGSAEWEQLQVLEMESLAEEALRVRLVQDRQGISSDSLEWWSSLL